MSQSQKNKISKALTGKRKTAEHRKKISQSMVKYWMTIPRFGEDLNNNEDKSKENE